MTLSRQRWLEISQEYYLRLSKDGFIQETQGNWKKFFINSDSVLIGKNIGDLFIFERNFLEKIFNENTYSTRALLLHENHDQVIIQWTFKESPEKDCIYAAGLDVTEKNRAKTFFEETEKISGVGGWEIDLISKRLYWSRATHSIHETDPLTYQPKLEDGISFYHPDAIPELSHAVELLMTQGVSFDLTLKFITAKGNHRWVRSIAHAEVVQGSPIRVFGSFQDVTEAKKREQELKTLNERLTFVLEGSKLGSFDWWLEESKVYFDRYWAVMLGVDPEKIQHDFKTWESRCHPDDLPRAHKEIQDHLLGKKEQYECLHRLRHENGQWLWILGRGKITERTPDGRPIRFSGTNLDMTQQKNAETQMIHSAKMASLGEMASGIAHEINNPLTIIHGKSMQIKKALQASSTDHEKIIADVDKIFHTSERIAKIVKGLRSFSRNGDHDPMVTTSLHKILDDTLEICTERFKTKRIQILRDILPEHENLLCRPVQIEQVMMNLLCNAYDAIHAHESPWIKVETFSTPRHWGIRVTDSGTGIPDSIVAKMMQPFFTTKEVNRGTGLGLSISKGIIEDHGGQLRYTLHEGHTAFELIFPPQAAGQRQAA